MCVLRVYELIRRFPIVYEMKGYLFTLKITLSIKEDFSLRNWFTRVHLGQFNKESVKVKFESVKIPRREQIKDGHSL